MKLKKFCAAVLLLSLVIPYSAVSNSAADLDLLKKVADRLKENDQLAGEIGFSQEALIKEFNSDGKLTKKETLVYETRWINDSRYLELVKVDGKELDQERKKDEEKRRKHFIKETSKKKEVTLENKMEVTWDDLISKYDFWLQEPDDHASHVISFKPNSSKKKERNRLEKILNHISGTVWVDSGYNILKAYLKLDDNVKYGLGIIANVEKVDLHYQQKKVDKVWVPDSFSLEYKARVVVKTRIRQIESRFFDFAPRETVTSAASQ